MAELILTDKERAAHFDQLGKVCGRCDIGVFAIDNNGYNTFLRCKQCKHVPFVVNSIDIYSNYVKAAKDKQNDK